MFENVRKGDESTALETMSQSRLELSPVKLEVN